MTDSGAERAARRIADELGHLTPDVHCSKEEQDAAESKALALVAAIIREETGTQLSAEFDIYEARDTGEMWVTVMTSLGTAAFGASKGSVRGAVLKSALPAAPDEGGTR